MIEARNIKINNDKTISLEYKSDLDDDYIYLEFDIETLEIINTSIIEDTLVRTNMLYSHLIKQLKELYDKKELKENYKNLWY
mgnify:CR=1 FL=1